MPTISVSDRKSRAHSTLLIVVSLLAAFAFQARSAFAQEERSRFEIGSVFAQYHAPALSKAVTDQFALGGRFTWNWLPHLSLEAEYASSLEKPGAETQNDGGYFSQALFGVKSGVRWKRWGVFGKFRPGLITYSMAIKSVNTKGTGAPIEFGRLNNAAYDIGGGAEFFLSRHWLFRYDAGDLITHQGSLGVPINAQRIIFPSFTNHNFESEVSVAFRF